MGSPILHNYFKSNKNDGSKILPHWHFTHLPYLIPKEDLMRILHLFRDFENVCIHTCTHVRNPSVHVHLPYTCAPNISHTYNITSFQRLWECMCVHACTQYQHIPHKELQRLACIHICAHSHKHTHTTHAHMLTITNMQVKAEMHIHTQIFGKGTRKD